MYQKLAPELRRRARYPRRTAADFFGAARRIVMFNRDHNTANVGIRLLAEGANVYQFASVGRLAQLDRALASEAKGHWFESSNAHSSLVKPPGRIFRELRSRYAR
jgi:hypothetical protein